MCGRFAFWANKNKCLEHFEVASAPDFKSSYNVTPSSNIPVIRRRVADKELVNCHWGLIPHWAKEKKHKPIYARAETIAEKPFFRDSFSKRRCLIPANGFYEWHGPKGQKQPYFIKLDNSELFAFAGLWEYWERPDEEIESCTIITTEANQLMATIHDRMPVILDPEHYDAWLEEGGTDLLMPYSGEMSVHPVSTKVNSPKSDGAALIEPL
ncbi:MAG: SOS response-associated peptidase [Gammaproteobacteria bacterium]